MNESDLARRIVSNLSASAHAIDTDVAQRLQRARARSLLVQRQGRWRAPSAHGMRPLRLPFAFSPAMRSAVLALVLLVVFMAGNHWSTSSRIHELQAVDAALLMDDLPIDAYLDPDFRAWLVRESRS